ncbi:MAG: hypothetical protein WCO56_09570 [Verrucomicrobiota bacterium]
MKTLVPILVLGGMLSANHLYADAATILKQRARGMANPPEQGGGAPARPQPPAPPPAPSAEPEVPAKPGAAKLSAAQLESAKELQSNLDAIKAKGQATAELNQKLMTALESTTKAGTKPDKSTLTSLAADLATAWPTLKMNEAEKATLVKNVVILLNAQSLANVDLPAVIQSSEALLKFSGLNADASRKILNDLKCVLADVQKY